jgi:nitronate monooxygenase
MSIKAMVPRSYRNALLDLLDIELPIVQAPMAGVSTPEMAAAVTNAGGLGSLGVGASDAAGARSMIRAVRQLTKGSLNVNVFCHQSPRRDAAIEAEWIERLRPEFARLGLTPPSRLQQIYSSFRSDTDMLKVLLEEKPRVVSFHFGLPPPETLRLLAEAGIVLLGCATTLAEALTIKDAGLDAVVAQGYEAGGHRGAFRPDQADDQLATLPLTRILSARLNVPLIAAGGIMDGAGIAAALALGASAALLGTAFVACTESQADEGYRVAIKSAAANRTVMTRAISGRPARCLPNRFTQLGSAVADDRIPSYPIAYDIAKALHSQAKASGEFGYGAQWAGQGAPMIRQGSAAELMQALTAELFAEKDPRSATSLPI